MPATQTKNYTAVGKRPIRHDGYDKVTGRAAYGADVNLPGMLHAKVLRSPHAHAVIASVDTSRAEAHPGVRAVVTSADFPEYENKPVTGAAGGPPQNMHHVSSKIMARGKVLFRGHPVAAVAADSAHEAEEALELIDVVYEPLPAVTSVEDAMADGAPLLHPEFANNVASHSRLAIGDVDEGFAQAESVIEREFRTKTVHQGYIEPHSATAWWTPQDRVTVWCSSQGHFQIRDLTAAVVGVPFSSVKVVPMEIGGGFGGKTTIYLEPLAVALSKKSGAPVKITMNRIEVMEATGPTSGSYMKVKIGVDGAGRMTAARADLRFEAGAFPGSPVGAAANCIFSPYDIPNIVIDAYDVVDNKPKTTAYRAPGAPIGSFAAETIIDEFCERLGMDPIDFRILNGAKEGDAPRRRRDQPAHRRDRNRPSRQRPRPLRGRARRQVARQGSRQRVLDKRHGPRLRHRQPQLRRHRQPDHRLHGHRRHAPGGGAAVRRSLGHPRRERQPAGRRHRIHRLHVHDRRLRRGVQDGLGELRSRPGRQAPDARPRRHAVGDRRRTGGARRRRLPTPRRPGAEHDLRRPRRARVRDGRAYRGQRQHGPGRSGQRLRHAHRRH